MANFRIRIVLLGVVLAFNIHTVLGEGFGEFLPVIRGVGVCEDSGTEELIKFINPKLTKVGRNQQNIVTTVVTKIPVDDSIDFYVEVAIWGNGGWKKNFFRLEEKHFVSWFFDKVPATAGAVLNQTGYPEPPVPPGTYDLDVPVSLINVRNIPQVPHGKFASETFFVKDDQAVGCLAMNVDMLPRSNGRRKKKKQKS